MAYIIQYSKRAASDITSLGAHIKQRIVAKLEYFSASPDPMRYAKALTGQISGLYRFRIGDYRVIFELKRNGLIVILYVVHVGHRKEVY